jgi:RNA polymerase sigma-70 factor (ECF subfamily)
MTDIQARETEFPTDGIPTADDAAEQRAGRSTGVGSPGVGSASVRNGLTCSLPNLAECLPAANGSTAQLQAVAPVALVDLTVLVNEHAPVLYRYAYRLTGSAADAEDLTQQTFLLGYRKLAQLRDAAGARSWLMAILRREFLRTAIKRSVERRLVVPLDVDSLPAELTERWEIDEEALQNAIDHLPDAYKLVVLSFYFEDRSYREIAEQLDLPVGTVMSRLSRAKAQLRSRLFEREFQTADRNITDRSVTDRSATEWPASQRPEGET